MLVKPPQLLVSVRSPEETRAAFNGGCDILDVKEPANGSLGMAAVETIAAIVNTVATHESLPSETSISAALGETVDWLSRDAVPTLPAGLKFAKLGTAGMSGIADWQSAWMGVRKRFEEASSAPRNWIAVSYADWQRAESPQPEAMIDAAQKTGCAGVLFDTFYKDGRTLFDEIPQDRLTRLVNAIRKQGMIAAIAGSLSLTELPDAIDLQPDIIAVRSAACSQGKRIAEICTQAVRRLRDTMSDHISRERKRPIHSA